MFENYSSYIRLATSLVLLSSASNIQGKPTNSARPIPASVPARIVSPMAAVSYSQPSNPFPVLTFGSRRYYIDLDADGDQDMLYQNSANNGEAISVILNNGNGTFGSPINAVYTPGASPGNTSTSTGTGTFNSGPLNGITFRQISSSSSSLFVVDYDNDGDLDIVEPINNAAGYLNRNNGNGTYSVVATNPFPVLTFGTRRIYYDVDADGDQDMLYQNGNTSGVGISLMLNNGDGMFASPINANGSGTFTSGPLNGITFTQISSSSFFVIDYDDDGDQDLIETVNATAGRIIRNNGNGTSTVAPTNPFPVLTFGARRIYFDVDADGDQDMLYQNGNTSGVGISLILNNGDGTFASPINANGSGTFTSGPLNGITFTQVTTSTLLSVDYDKDSDQDLVELVNNSAGRVIRQEGSPPKLQSTNPADNATNVNPVSSLTLTFDRSVNKGNGNLYVVRTSDNVKVETIPVGNAKVTGSGTTWVLDPSITLTELTSYALQTDEEIFIDIDGRAFSGILNTTTFNFTTGVANKVPTDITLIASSVAENQPVSTVVGSLSSTDPDAGQTFSYSLVSGAGSTDNASFKLVGNQLQTNATFDYETKNSYSIRLQTTDNGVPALSFQKSFTITITNVNEPPIINPQSFSVNENSSNGTVVGTVMASDPDASTTLSYSVTAGNTNGAFSMVGNSLQVANASALNFETTPVFSLTIRVSDGSLSSSAAVTVNLNNVNELTASILTHSDVICGSTASGTATVTVSGEAGPYTYNWLPGNPPGDGTATVTGLAAGSYTVIVTATTTSFTAAAFVTISPCTTPDLTPIIYARPSTANGTTNITVVVDVVELNSVASSGLVTVKINKDVLISLTFPNSATIVGDRSVQNNAWSFDGTSNQVYYLLTTTQAVAAGDKLSFGLSGVLNPGGTTGSSSISSVIDVGSGGEVKITNNVDADKLDYFQQ